MPPVFRLADLDAAIARLAPDDQAHPAILALRDALSTQTAAPVSTARGGRRAHAGRPPFGYRYAKRSATYTIVEAEARIIREIVALRDAGQSLQEIADDLNRRQVPTRLAGARWHASTIRGILANEALYRHHATYPPLLVAAAAPSPEPPAPVAAVREDWMEDYLRERDAWRFCNTDTRAILQCRIALQGIVPPIWRRFVVPAATAIHDFVPILNIVMGWDGFHLFELVWGHEEAYRSPMLGEGSTVDGNTPLARIAKQGTWLGYRYDMGDCWDHDITIEKVFLPRPQARYPRLVAGSRACPPEDCGGPDIYVHYLLALGHPGRRGNRELKARMGKGFDPKAFDLAAHDAELGEYLRRHP